MAQGKELIKLVLYGKPIKTSLSPAIHRMFADQFDLNISYELVETGADEFPAALESFRLSGGSGCNVTLPLKQDAWRLSSRASKEVTLSQAANTLVYDSSSGWLANTTDGIGLVTDMTVNNGIEIAGKRILILGAGGATASVLGSLLECKPSVLVLVNRNLDRANALKERFDCLGNLAVISWDDLSGHTDFDLLINATSLGHHGQAPVLHQGLFAPGAVCYDLNYYKASLPLKKLCGALQQTYVDGLGMLVEQAAASFQIWTGKQADTAVVIKAFRDGGC